MESVNYSIAKAQLSKLLDNAIHKQPIEITRKGRESAILVSKSTYDALKNLELDKKFLKDT